MTIKEQIIGFHFNTFNPNAEMFVNLKNFGTGNPPQSVMMVLDYMEDDGFISLSRKSEFVYGVTPTQRGIDHFRNLIRLQIENSKI